MFYPVMTADHYKHFFEYLRRNGKASSSFFDRGSMAFIKAAHDIFKGSISHASRIRDPIRPALVSSFTRNQHGRFIEFLKILQETYAEKDTQVTGMVTLFEDFMIRFLDSIKVLDTSRSIKRFLTIHKEWLREHHPSILDAFCSALVNSLNARWSDPRAAEFLNGSIGQPSLLTSTSFAKGLLFYYKNKHPNCRQFSDMAWREAVAEVLTNDTQRAKEALWREIVEYKLGRQFPSQYPPTDAIREAVLATFQTKHEKEIEWTTTYVPDFLARLLAQLQSPDFQLLLPKALMPIIVDYVGVTARTWLDISEA